MLEKEKDEENNSIKKIFLSLIRVISDICTFSN